VIRRDFPSRRFDEMPPPLLAPPFSAARIAVIPEARRLMPPPPLCRAYIHYATPRFPR